MLLLWVYKMPLCLSSSEKSLVYARRSRQQSASALLGLSGTGSDMRHFILEPFLGSLCGREGIAKVEVVT